ncbi:MAG: CvpA family protein [Candidatus Marinimicrobia bacterium]|nr:CvpA family protein [Candidatus Neomarinimicrobiota bacterium]
MYWMDVVALIIIIWFVYKDYSSGLILSLFRFVGLILGIILSAKYGYYLVEFLINKFSFPEQVGQIVGYVIIFIVVLIVVQLIGNLLKSTLNVILLGWLDKIAGAILGFVKASILISLIFWGLMILPINRLTDTIKYSSKSFSIFENVAPTTYNIIIKPFMNGVDINLHFDSFSNKIDKYNNDKNFDLQDLNKLLNNVDKLTFQDIQYIQSVYKDLTPAEKKGINSLLKQGGSKMEEAIELLKNY